MKTIQLGQTDLQVSKLCFGGNVLGWTLDEPQSYKILDEFTALGFNFIDTADAYSRWVPGNTGGESENILGQWMKSRGKRQDLVIATKVGSDMGRGRTLNHKHIIQSAEDSLRRLQTDYIDLYQSHYDDPNTPFEEVFKAYAHLIETGKVRWIGASNFEAGRLEASIAFSKAENLPVYHSLQPLYNLYDREHYENNLAALCATENLAVIPYYSLASGFLTGKYRSNADLAQSARGAGVEKYLNPKGYNILKVLDLLEEKHEVTPAAIALNWLMSRKQVVAPIVSATKSHHLIAFKEALELHLDTQDLQLLNAAAASTDHA